MCLLFCCILDVVLCLCEKKTVEKKIRRAHDFSKKKKMGTDNLFIINKHYNIPKYLF